MQPLQTLVQLCLRFWQLVCELFESLNQHGCLLPELESVEVQAAPDKLVG
jgi:hypothetical protein